MQPINAEYVLAEAGLPDEGHLVRVITADGTGSFCAVRDGRRWIVPYFTGDGWDQFTTMIKKNEIWSFLKNER